MESFNLLFLLAGLLLGSALVWLYLRSRGGLTQGEASALREQKEEALRTISRLEERNERLDAEAQEQRNRMQQQMDRANESEKKLARRETELENLQDRLDEQKEEMQALQERFKEEFENLANKILEEKSKKFTEQNKEKLDQLLKPLGEKLQEFKKQVEETHKEDLKGRSSLEQHLKHLYELNQQMSKEAKDLTRALKGDTGKQGKWGEVILQRILEKSGLTEGREYETQVGARTEEGGQRILDVVVKLPDEKHIIIDSKVSLSAYEQFISAEEDEEREKHLKQHVQSMRSHVKGLSSKNYQELYGEYSPDFVLMFVPIESAFGVALQQDTDLYYEAFEKNIVIVSPSTLLATLATIDSVWKQEYQNKNAMEIAERGGALYDKFTLFVESMEDIGQRIRQTQDSYDQAMTRLSAGHGNVIRQVEMLRELGAKASKKLPEHLADPKELEENSAGRDGEEANGS
ncbi:MAG: DNA recombination protein RmuC [Balneolaceae bacterium]|nr:DNA recombination protein RmuC [Balneolaceae bacterium]